MPVLVRFAGDGCRQVLPAAADRQAGGGVAHGLEEFEVAMCMAGLAFSGGSEQRGHIVLPFDVGLVSEIQVPAVGLRFAGEGVLPCGSPAASRFR